MAPKNPIGRLADTAISTLRNPLDTAGKVVEQAKGTAALGRMVAEQVGRTAVGKAADTAGAVVGRATGRGTGKPEAYAPREDLSSEAKLRPVPDVNEPGHTPAENKAAGSESPTQKAAQPVKKAAQTVEKAADTVERAAERVEGTADAAAKKASAKKSTDSATKKSTVSKTAAKKPAGKKPTAKKVTATPADVAEVVESAVKEDPKKTAATKATSPAKKQAAKKAPAKKAPAKKTTAKRSSPGDKLPKKATGRGKAPRSANQVENLEGTDLLDTPAGTPAAGPGSNPDTTEKELHQPGTEGIVEESTAKAVAKETAMLRKAAEKNPK